MNLLFWQIGIVLLFEMIDIFLLLCFFNFVSDSRLPRRQIVILSAIICVCKAIISIISVNFLHLDITFIFLIFFFLSLPMILDHYSGLSIKLFFGIFSMVVVNIFLRFMTFFICPLFNIDTKEVNNNYLSLYFFDYLSIIVSFYFVKLFSYDFNSWKVNLDSKVGKLLLNTINISMIIYFVIIQLLTMVQFSNINIDTSNPRKIIVLFYLFLFFSLLAIIDRNVKNNLYQEILSQKEKQLIDLSNYSRQIEKII
ncbi:hypothetical protein HMPREF9318_01353 [Streptococcus urinalis FB127-CNA-2]|uniref:Membrane protein n=1 Tax=Streptococcus urinalis 2285-97 TaxID=764291 RepID=G5KCT3_9STRE|nr:hypothetical protein [Streptococcus urinalis]EHJ57340.1 putative membrane protein [Streptococcus urinalis 2285-97]EKS19277.1 hypothetical protein HMPREF9318_01353 [Streptococcus urinalis FB127-CNA-2]VEF31408.1 two-component response regulator histidine kinase [Streptococcus urinalis]